MAHKILTKWIEPYVLLEKLKKHFSMLDYTFDGQSKVTVKKDFLQKLKKEEYSLGLYMKNVNKFYIFTSPSKINLDEILDFKREDYDVSDDIETPFNLIDMGKAEASFIIVK